jgi:hypothetical protein
VEYLLDTILENGLPYSKDSEQAILGAVLLKNTLIEQVRSCLNKYDFYLASHRRILESMLNLYSQGMSIDLVTLKADLEARRAFEEVGGVTYLSSLIDTVPRTDSIEFYARIVRQHSQRRKLIRAANLSIARAASGIEDFNSIISDLHRTLSELNRDAPGDGLLVRRLLADVQPEYVSFLWEPYIPLGKLTLIEGDPGVGKSWLACALATATAAGLGPNGWAMDEPHNVLLLSVEDGLADTIRPRLDVMRANVQRIHALEGTLTLDQHGLLLLERHISEIRPTLLVIDPLVAYLGAGVDLHRANEVRVVTSRLALMAEKHGCAIIGVRHLSKSPKDRAIYRGIGSIDFTAAARSVLLVGTDPSDPAKHAIAHIKSNLAELGGAVGYEIRDGRFCWTGDSDLTAELMLGAANSQVERNTIADAKDFLREILSEGPLASEDVQRDAGNTGISRSTLNRARLELGIKGKPYVFKTGQPGTNDQKWFWQLPPEVTQANSEDTQRETDEYLRANYDKKGAKENNLSEVTQDFLA